MCGLTSVSTSSTLSISSSVLDFVSYRFVFFPSKEAMSSLAASAGGAGGGKTVEKKTMENTAKLHAEYGTNTKY